MAKASGLPWHEQRLVLDGKELAAEAGDTLCSVGACAGSSLLVLPYPRVGGWESSEAAAASDSPAREAERLERHLEASKKSEAEIRQTLYLFDLPTARTLSSPPRRVVDHHQLLHGPTLRVGSVPVFGLREPVGFKTLKPAVLSQLVAAHAQAIAGRLRGGGDSSRAIGTDELAARQATDDVAERAKAELFAAIDKDRSGAIERDEFVAFFLPLATDHKAILEWWTDLAAASPASHCDKAAFGRWAEGSPAQFQAAKQLVDQAASARPSKAQQLEQLLDRQLVSFKGAEIVQQGSDVGDIVADGSLRPEVGDPVVCVIHGRDKRGKLIKDDGTSTPFKVKFVDGEESGPLHMEDVKPEDTSKAARWIAALAARHASELVVRAADGEKLVVGKLAAGSLELKVGDPVVIETGLLKGERGKLIQDKRSPTPIKVRFDDGETSGWLSTEQVVVDTQASTLQAKIQSVTSKDLVVGDPVVIVGVKCNGKRGKIIENRSSTPFNVKLDNGDDSGWLSKGDIKKDEWAALQARLAVETPLRLASKFEWVDGQVVPLMASVVRDGNMLKGQLALKPRLNEVKPCPGSDWRVRMLSPVAGVLRCATLTIQEGHQQICTSDNDGGELDRLSLNRLQLSSLSQGTATLGDGTQASVVISSDTTIRGDGVQAVVALDIPAADDRCEVGQRLVVVRPKDGILIDAAVATYAPNPKQPARHMLALFDGSAPLPYDLDSFNHCQQCLSSVEAHSNIIVTYCRGLVATTEYAEDGITATKLRTKDQLLAIEARSDVGVTREGFSDVQTIVALCYALLAPSLQRAHGIHHTQPVLICAEAGTGKTWASVQLVNKLAIKCMQAAETRMGTPLVPVCTTRPFSYPRTHFSMELSPL